MSKNKRVEIYIGRQFMDFIGDLWHGYAYMDDDYIRYDEPYIEICMNCTYENYIVSKYNMNKIFMIGDEETMLKTLPIPKQKL